MAETGDVKIATFRSTTPKRLRDLFRWLESVEAVACGILIACLNLPNGNPQPGPQFAYKLAWFERLPKAMRLEHLLLSPQLVRQLAHAGVDRSPELGIRHSTFLIKPKRSRSIRCKILPEPLFGSSASASGSSQQNQPRQGNCSANEIG